MAPTVIFKNRELLITELVKGQDFARELHALLQNQLGDDGVELAVQLLAKISTSFEQGLGLAAGSYSDMVGENALGHDQVSTLSSDNGGEGSVESRRPKKIRPDLKEKRGCYKRKKSFPREISITPTMEDGRPWRKYGQKSILNSKFQRSYFRCTHKYDRDCKATKQVQKLDDGTGMFRTTYIGFHTCDENPSNPAHLIVPKCPEPETKNKTEHVKEEIKDQAYTKSDSTDSSSLPRADRDLIIGFGFSSRQLQDQDEVSKMYRLGVEEYDGVHSEMELLVRDPAEFHSVFHFEETEFS